MPDQTLNFGVGNMIDMRKSRHSGKKIYYFLGKPLGEPIWGTRGDLGDKVVIFWIFLILALMGPPFSPPCPPNGGGGVENLGFFSPNGAPGENMFFLEIGG